MSGVQKKVSIGVAGFFFESELISLLGWRLVELKQLALRTFSAFGLLLLFV